MSFQLFGHITRVSNIVVTKEDMGAATVRSGRNTRAVMKSVMCHNICHNQGCICLTDVFITLSKEASSFTICTYITVVAQIEDINLYIV